jgi:hypothetical protein
VDVIVSRRHEISYGALVGYSPDETPHSIDGQNLKMDK